MDVLYCFANVSLTRRILVYLPQRLRSQLQSVTLFYLQDAWAMRIALKDTISCELEDNLRAFLDENGVPCPLTPHLRQAIDALDAGMTPVAVMNRCQVVVVSHGQPCLDELRHFQERFAAGLGYRPPSLV